MFLGSLVFLGLFSLLFFASLILVLTPVNEMFREEVFVFREMLFRLELVPEILFRFGVFGREDVEDWDVLGLGREDDCVAEVDALGPEMAEPEVPEAAEAST